MKKVADLNSEISAASQEQANGIEQISKAMNQLDQAIQNNASSSERVAKSAQDLTSQAESLNVQVSSLRQFVNGQSSNQKLAPSKPYQTPTHSESNHKKVVKLDPKKKSEMKATEIFPLDDKEAKIGKAEGF